MDQDPEGSESQDDLRPHVGNDHGVHSHPAPEHTQALEHAASRLRPDFQELRWHRLKKDYQDQYLDLFNETHNQQQEQSVFDDSQYGSVRWSSQEKLSLFQALDRRGRHDLPAISQVIGTKSVAEVRDYLCRLQDAHMDRQMFSNYTKNITHADMAGAVEIGEDCEAGLEIAADALGAFQDNFDRLVAQQTGHDIWLIDAETARITDGTTDSQDKDEPDLDTVRNSDDDDVLSFFHLSTCLELSRKCFMNSPISGQDWRDIAEGGESPAMTVQVLEDMHDIVVSLVQRILQTAMFLAQSRQRSTTTQNYVPSATLKSIDIETALSILEMSADSWQFWTAYPRRSGVHVELDGRNLTLQEIEDVLSVRGFRGRRRSLSSLVSAPSSRSRSDDASTPQNLVQPSDTVSQYESTEDDLSTHDPDSTDESADQHDNKRRRLRSDSIEDEYLEELDQATRMAEEARIQTLMSEPGVTAESVPEFNKPRPFSKRKTADDLKDWSVVCYKSSWEEQVEEPATEVEPFT